MMPINIDILWADKYTYPSVSFFSQPLPVDGRAGCAVTGGCGDDTLPSCMFFSACSAPRGLLALVSG